jgi:hypothetical protein
VCVVHVRCVCVLHVCAVCVLCVFCVCGVCGVYVCVCFVCVLCVCVWCVCLCELCVVCVCVLCMCVVCVCVVCVYCVCCVFCVCVVCENITLLPMATRFVLKQWKFTTPISCKNFSLRRKSSCPVHENFEEIIANQKLVQVTGGEHAFHTPPDRLHCHTIYEAPHCAIFCSLLSRPPHRCHIPTALFPDMQ